VPTVKKGKNGYDIVSRRRGRYITHQLTPEGAKILQQRYGVIDGLEIDVPTLMELKQSQDAYTQRERRHWRDRPREDELFATAPPPVAPPLPRFEPVAPPPETIPCPRCSRRVISGAAYCNHCGAAIVRTPSSARLLSGALTGLAVGLGLAGGAAVLIAGIGYQWEAVHQLNVDRVAWGMIGVGLLAGAGLVERAAMLTKR
jgi:hypothetical protein